MASIAGTKNLGRQLLKTYRVVGIQRPLRCFSSVGDNKSHVVGFLGLGNMGLPMALNLAKTRQVLAFDPNPRAMDVAKEGGVLASDSAYNVGKEADVIVTMLPGCDFLNSVMETLVDASKDKKTLFVDCSTVSPTTSRYWHEKVQEDGHEMYEN